jgi:hypothetical protein
MTALIIHRLYQKKNSPRKESYILNLTGGAGRARTLDRLNANLAL